VVAQTRSLSPSTEPRVVAAAFVAVVVFAGAWALLHVGFYTRSQIIDTPVYQRYGNAMARGEVPYRDFSVEYPPGALPMFALPGLAEPGNDQNVTLGFRHRFETLMWLCGAAALLAMAVALSSVGAGQIHVWGAVAFAALAPLALGSVVLSRFDLWPAALVVGALAALVAGWLRLGSGLLGLAIAVKLFPAVLVPLTLAYVWRREGRREALACAGVLAAVVAVVFAPFVALSPGGVWHSVSVQLTRPLQIESLGSALLIAAHHVWGFGITMETSHGSQNLAGGAPNALAVVQTVVQAAALVAVWVAFALGSPTRAALVRASAAALVVFVALGKVLSPQFLIWLIPIVPLVRGRRGLWASGLLGVALVLTQLWFPFRYWDLANHFDATTSWLVLARDVLLLALAAVLVFPLTGRGRDLSGRVQDGPPVPGTVTKV
jgi:Glycosyltransferase family 87